MYQNFVRFFFSRSPYFHRFRKLQSMKMMVLNEMNVKMIFSFSLSHFGCCCCCCYTSNYISKLSIVVCRLMVMVSRQNRENVIYHHRHHRVYFLYLFFFLKMCFFSFLPDRKDLFVNQKKKTKTKKPIHYLFTRIFTTKKIHSLSLTFCLLLSSPILFFLLLFGMDLQVISLFSINRNFKLGNKQILILSFILILFFCLLFWQLKLNSFFSLSLSFLTFIL